MQKLWNRPSYPVWSLVTHDKAGQANMNICTYVMSVSMSPKLMTIAVYENTKTLANLEEVPHQNVLLQLLSEKQASLVRMLGKQSGHAIDKMARLEKRSLLDRSGNYVYLKDAAGYVVLTNLMRSEVSGDHILYTGTVEKQKNLHEVPILTTLFLREKGYIR